jgi:hypothetical protein
MAISWQSQLKPTVALLSLQGELVSLQVLLEPFFWKGELSKTSIRLDRIGIPSPYLKDLVGRAFKFPRNPTAGYIDGSVCIEETHQYVDVTEIAFHRSRAGTGAVVIKGFYCGDGLDEAEFPFVLNAPVACLMV